MTTARWREANGQEARGPLRSPVGSALLVVAVVHILVGPVFYTESLTSIIEGGVFGAVDAEPGLVPLSPFWLFFPIAAMVAHSRRRLAAGDMSPT